MIEKLELEQNPLSETVEKIREICPAAVTRDGKIDFEELKTSLATDVAEDTIEKYEFTWVGKNAAKAEANRPIRKTLRPVVADSKDWDNTKNLYIEGDNLDALKLLQESYLGKVKMIYIDPPYNTGNDFVYCDNFKMGCAEFIEKSGQCDADGNRLFANTKTNGRFHSDWCSMMYSRLKIARNLLTDDGVIFISIDEHEVANLKKVCDEIFGESNFYTNFAWLNSVSDEVNDDTKFAGANLGKIKSSYEHILVYGKTSLYTMSLDKPSSDTIIKLITNGDNNINELHVPSGIKCVNKINKTFYGHIGGNNDFYDIINPEGMIIQDGVLKNEVTIRGPLRNHNMLTKFFNGEEVIDAKGQKLIDVFISETGMLHTKKERKGDTPSNVLVGKSTTKNGTQMLKNMFDGNKIFDFVKPIELIRYLIEKASVYTDFIVMDFFSGSATTAHAVMQLNAEDGGNRRYIMVQLPEKCDEKSEAFKAGYKNICEIGKERIRRAGEKIKAENPDKDLDVGFRVLRVDSDNMADIAKRPSDVTQGQLKLDVENIVPERSDLDLLFGVMVDCGLMLDMPIETKQMDDKTYYVVNHGDLVACFEKNIPEKLIYEIARMNPVCAVFRDSSFAEPKDKINLAEIFKNITGNDKCVKVL